MTAGKILEENPKLHIQFGLHASSVREHLEDISGVDDRVEIVWEDCGAFPFKAADPGFAAPFSEEAYQKKQLFRDRKSTRLNSSHWLRSRMPSSA